MVKKETVKEVGGFLSQPAEAVVSLGPLAFLGGMSLWIVIPTLLLLIGLGIYLTIQLLPFLVAGLVMMIFWFIFKLFKVKEPWLYIGPMVLGGIALVPALLPQTQGLIASGATAQVAAAQRATAQGFLMTMMKFLVGGSMFIVAFFVMGFLMIGLAALYKVGTPGAFMAGFLGIGLGLAIATEAVNLGAGMPMAEPTAIGYTLGVPNWAWIASVSGLVSAGIVYIGQLREWF